jgi:hypothetical protein
MMIAVENHTLIWYSVVTFLVLINVRAIYEWRTLSTLNSDDWYVLGIFFYQPLWGRLSRNIQIRYAPEYAGQRLVPEFWNDCIGISERINITDGMAKSKVLTPKNTLREEFEELTGNWTMENNIEGKGMSRNSLEISLRRHRLLSYSRLVLWFYVILKLRNAANWRAFICGICDANLTFSKASEPQLKIPLFLWIDIKQKIQELDDNYLLSAWKRTMKKGQDVKISVKILPYHLQNVYTIPKKIIGAPWYWGCSKFSHRIKKVPTNQEIAIAMAIGVSGETSFFGNDGSFFVECELNKNRILNRRGDSTDRRPGTIDCRTSDCEYQFTGTELEDSDTCPGCGCEVMHNPLIHEAFFPYYLEFSKKIELVFGDKYTPSRVTQGNDSGGSRFVWRVAEIEERKYRWIANNVRDSDGFLQPPIWLGEFNSQDTYILNENLSEEQKKLAAKTAVEFVCEIPSPVHCERRGAGSRKWRVQIELDRKCWYFVVPLCRLGEMSGAGCANNNWPILSNRTNEPEKQASKASISGQPQQLRFWLKQYGDKIGFKNPIKYIAYEQLRHQIEDPLDEGGGLCMERYRTTTQGYNVLPRDDMRDLVNQRLQAFNTARDSAISSGNSPSESEKAGKDAAKKIGTMKNRFSYPPLETDLYPGKKLPVPLQNTFVKPFRMGCYLMGCQACREDEYFPWQPKNFSSQKAQELFDKTRGKHPELSINDIPGSGRECGINGLERHVNMTDVRNFVGQLEEEA